MSLAAGFKIAVKSSVTDKYSSSKISPAAGSKIAVHESSDAPGLNLAFAAASKIVSGSSLQGSSMDDETPKDPSFNLAFATATTILSQSSGNPSYIFASTSAFKIAVRSSVTENDSSSAMPLAAGS